MTLTATNVASPVLAAAPEKEASTPVKVAIVAAILFGSIGQLFVLMFNTTQYSYGLPIGAVVGLTYSFLADKHKEGFLDNKHMILVFLVTTTALALIFSKIPVFSAFPAIATGAVTICSFLRPDFTPKLQSQAIA